MSSPSMPPGAAADGPDLAGRRLTPMLRQYLDAKAECPPGALLLFRMGDFYELFFDDAVTAARELELTLTSRDKGDDPIPMAGVPHHAADQYIARLVQKGFTVGICDQIEDPRFARGLVRRAVTRLVTPGTVSDLDALDPGSSQYVGWAAPVDGAVALVLLDLLAGELLCTRVAGAALADEIDRMGVRELLVESASGEELGRALAGRVAVRPADGEPPSPQACAALLGEKLGPRGLDALEGGGTEAERLGLARVVTYAEQTQRRPLTHFVPPRAYRSTDFLVLDEATRRNLELLRAGPAAEKHGSLLWHLDRCRTAMGTRLLTQWLLFPLRDPAAIGRRLDAVEALKADRPLRERARELLARVRDAERLVGRVAVGRATPRDLGGLRETLGAVPDLRGLLSEQPSSLGARWREIDEVADLRGRLETALVDEPPYAAADGGIFRKGFDAELDELIGFADGGHAYLAEMERRERARSGIANLKVRYNKVFGYYIEVTKANLASVPADYVRKQTLVGAERFITEELKAHEEKVVHADERRRTRELELFAGVTAEVAAATARLRALGRLLAETDVLAALAVVADEGRYERPELTDEPVLELEGSRHPIVERLLPGGERFVPNDLRLSAADRQLVVITGPNMAGKSTVMRQAALCTLLAHVGSFVPAKRARVGLCDRLFTRVGAADHIGRGLSTFMVEMVETATILAHATPRSFVLLDEIGRGTSTFDGVSIAWAVAEHLHDAVGCRTMFATHYHELTDLALERPRIANASVAVKEHEDRVIFLRRLVDGPANRSYGIQVARLAGLPESVLARAREILANLENDELDEQGMPAIGRSRRQAASRGQLGLFVRRRSGTAAGAAGEAPATAGTARAGTAAVAEAVATSPSPRSESRSPSPVATGASASASQRAVAVGASGPAQANAGASDPRPSSDAYATALAAVARELRSLDPDHLTPIDALVALARLRRQLTEADPGAHEE